ncbi:hypothetical protein [Streptomyces palmae]|uniref:Uncharacterized protein n=1 Tax=Streptomyces palmae TaxID=1701085 RepID=A0A4Z0FRS8_9ACTN|nr:hypothetical protein [Streptomyces palmae]TGA83995.1 hypothetical protein E4099_31665 [Streptomyces palmae]
MEHKTDEPAQPEPERVSCARCGAIAEGTPLTWTCSVENGVRRYFCEECGRRNIRAIESRLDSSGW